MSKVIMIPDQDDSWAEVELYRWQHGKLRNAPGHVEQPFSAPEGLRGMAKAIELGDRNNFPTPFNVTAVLAYAARRIENSEEELKRTKRALDAANKILGENGLIGVLLDPPNSESEHETEK